MKIGLRALIASLILWSGEFAFSQDSISNYTRTNNSDLYVLKFDTLVSIKLNLNTDYDNFELKGSDFRYDIRPNLNLTHKLFMSYKYMSFSIGFNPWFLRNDKQLELHGKTKSFLMGFNIVSTHLLQDIQLKNTRGFYLKNTADFDPNWKEGTDPYIQFPYLKVHSIKGATGYKFNANYSIKAISTQSEKQLRSCGSFIPILSYEYATINNNSNNATVASSQKSINFQTDLSMGYAYNWVIAKNFLLSAAVLPGLLYQHSLLKTTVADVETKNYNNFVGLKVSGRAGVSYNSTYFFSGAELLMGTSSFQYPSMAIYQNQSHLFFQVYVGLRLIAPRFLRASLNEVESWLPEKVQKQLD